MKEKIYLEIKQRILRLTYEPGKILNIKELCREFGASQTPIREVLLRLEYEKLVAVLPRMGIRVTKIDFKELKEVYRCRILIEGELLQLVSKNISDKQLHEIKKIYDRCIEIKGEHLRDELVDLNKNFRSILFKVANCKTLQEISELLYTQTLRVWHLTFDESDVRSEIEIEANEIRETIKALSLKDENAIQKLREKIMLEWIDRLHKYFTRY